MLEEGELGRLHLGYGAKLGRHYEVGLEQHSSQVGGDGEEHREEAHPQGQGKEEEATLGNRAVKKVGAMRELRSRRRP